MKRRKALAILTATAVVSGLLPAGAAGAEEKDAFIQKLHSMYDEIEMEYRPGVRWWLAEGLNTDKTLADNIEEIYNNGFGSAEFLAMPEPSADSSIYGWGSEEWTADTMTIIKKATELNMGFSVTSGTNWANANLPDTYIVGGESYNPDNKAASQELDYTTIALPGGEQFAGELPKIGSVIGNNEGGALSDMHASDGAFATQTFQGAVAARILTARDGAGTDFQEGEGVGILDMDSLTDLSDLVTEQDGVYTLNWTAPEDGDYVILTYWMHGTSQTASPSVSTNYTINYIDKYGMEAVIDYWENVILNDELREIIRKNGKGEIYMDSLELTTSGAGGLLWGFDFKEEFQSRKGYDITPYLPLLTQAAMATQVTAAPRDYDYQPEGKENLQTAEKIRNDFYDVSTQMYRENVLKPLQDWLHSLNMTLRAEPSYGFYYEISTPGKYMDDIETESFAQNADIDLFRSFLGSANMYGKIMSSETGAIWFNASPSNYTRPLDDWVQLCYLQFANGVARTMFHGYSGLAGSEGDTQWPGHEGMYSFCTERWDQRQPTSEMYQDFTQMLARNQKVLQQGVPSRDLAVLRTDYSYFNYGYAEGRDTPFFNNQMYDEPYYYSDLTLQHAGYTYDYFSPQVLLDEENIHWTSDALQPDGVAYQAVLVYQETMEKDAAEKLLAIAKDGLPILFVDNIDETLTLTGEKNHNGEAASRSKFLNDTDEEVQAVISEIKALDNVKSVSDASEAQSALESLGVYPRVAFEKPNNKITTISRNDKENQIYYTFAYSFKSEVNRGEEPFSFTLAIEGEGAPYRIDDWTGEITKLNGAEIRDGKTYVPLTLVPGESVIVALDLSDTADKTGNSTAVKIEDEPIVLTDWNITLEDWNEGEKVINTEEKYGHTTTEVYYTTKKTEVPVKGGELAAWKDMEADGNLSEILGYEGAEMKDISGIGTYQTVFTLPEDYGNGQDVYLKIDDANRNAVAVYVNGQKANAVNTRTLTVDISALVNAGENTIQIRVASTLYNRVLTRGYYNFLGEDLTWEPDSYGLSGKVQIIPYHTEA